MSPQNTNSAARHTARQILDGEFALMSRNQLSDLWWQMCQHFREPGCAAAFAYLQKWLRTYNERH